PADTQARARLQGVRRGHTQARVQKKRRDSAADRAYRSLPRGAVLSGASVDSKVGTCRAAELSRHRALSAEAGISEIAVASQPDTEAAERALKAARRRKRRLRAARGRVRPARARG